MINEKNVNIGSTSWQWMYYSYSFNNIKEEGFKINSS